MTTTEINSKMNSILFQLNEQLGMWLGERLPRITDNWWEELVYDNLSYLQKEAVDKNHIKEIRGLDLASLLRIFDRNWFVINSKEFVNPRVRNDVRIMQEIRNTWAHISPQDITKDRVSNDLSTISFLMGQFDASSKQLRDIEHFQLDVEDEAISTDAADSSQDDQDKGEKQQHTQNESTAVNVPTPPQEITVGTVVHLISDQNAVGAVVGIAGNKYTVLINGKQFTYFREQFEPVVSTAAISYVPLKQVRSALTAFQVSNPGRNLYSLNAARIDFVPYQFRPALKMIKSDVPRILVADDVGVGKTIEAGLILKELEARNSVTSVLIICPRPLVAEKKWPLEMKRFDENFSQLDGSALSECISETDRDGEWPEKFNKTVIPYSLFNEDSVMGRQSTSKKKKKNIGLAELDPLPHFDLVIIDEAHNIRNSNTWGYRGVELFCRNADSVVFLTATPLQNSNSDLYTLLNLLRPDLVLDEGTFDTMSEPNQYVNNLLRIIRGLPDGWQEAGKEQIDNILKTSWGRNVIAHNPVFEDVYHFMEKQEVSREDRISMISKVEALHSFHSMINRTRRKDIEDFCIRRTETVEVPFDSYGQELYDSLMDFQSTALTMLHGSRSVRFMMCTIMRQAASCLYGLAPFMNDIIRRRMDQIREDGELYEYEEELNGEEENKLIELADLISARCENIPANDPKFDKMYEIIEEKQKEENNRVIIFSSFRHTLRYIRRRLEKKGIRVGQIDGDVADEERYNLRNRFLMDRIAENAIDVLLFSEVGCEGLDYQFCDTMINYDLPWNPMRIEQRIGRIDRRGQKSDTVKIHNMITTETIDGDIYFRCLKKIGVFEASIGECSDILGSIGDQIQKIMFDPNLTEEERKLKIEQMTDNEVMKVQELQRLEQDEKSLYGFDLSRMIQDMDVQNAESRWINPHTIQELLESFFKDYLGDGEYILGKQVNKMLRLAVDKRQNLLKDLSTFNLDFNNDAVKHWRSYLKSTSPMLSVTFDSEYAKDNRKVEFLTQMHPLVMQAARYENKDFPCELSIRVSDTGIAPGKYEFLIYAWKYVGLRPDIILIAQSDNEEVKKNILSYLQFASDVPDDEDHTEKWDEMDTAHYEIWKAEREKYISEVRAECEFRIDQQTQTYSRQEAILRRHIENSEDEKIRRMRSSQLESLRRQNDVKRQEFEDAIKSADIHTNLLVRGVVKIEATKEE